ncbi:MAG TPA: hypothetical protein VJ276_05455 [Thermoanaerobaculia bacterium]|nr:hypothetical protein [Thermoanaerobaculia bacterium]
MARKKKADVDERWEHYLSIQLTPDQKAAARAEAQKRIDKAKADGAYERVAEIFEKVEWSISYEEMVDKEPREE